MDIRTQSAAAVIVAAALAAPVVSVPTSSADTRVVIGGTRFGVVPADFDYAKWMESERSIGANWVPDAASVELVDYPASAGPLNKDIPMDESVLIGAVSGIDTVQGQISAGSGTVSVVGVSQGALAAEKMIASWADDPQAPSPDKLRFVLIGDPARGSFRLFDPGVVVGGVDVTVFRPTDSPYDVDVIVGEFDGFADPPDRFWNLVALSNAILGIVYVHTSPLMVQTRPHDTVLMSRVVNAAGGTTSTYLIPTPYLPLTMPLRGLGVDSAFVDSLDASLRPVITSAYTRYDAKAPAPAVAAAPSVTTSAAPSVTTSAAPSVTTSAAPSVTTSAAPSVVVTIPEADSAAASDSAKDTAVRRPPGDASPAPATRRSVRAPVSPAGAGEVGPTLSRARIRDAR